jgi:hypothetical protein
MSLDGTCYDEMTPLFLFFFCSLGSQLIIREAIGEREERGRRLAGWRRRGVGCRHQFVGVSVGLSGVLLLCQFFVNSTSCAYY